MARIEGFRVRNFGPLQDIALGRFWNEGSQKDSLTPLTAVIGQNGVGKSTLFNAFGFLADALRDGVEVASDARGRGGFKRIKTQGTEGPIAFEIYYRQTSDSRPITYELAIDLDPIGRPYVSRERLRQRRKGQKTGWPFSFLILNNGKGEVWKGEEGGRQIVEKNTLSGQAENSEISGEEQGSREDVELDDSRRLGISTLGAMRQHPRISAFRRFVEGWYLSYFDPNAARDLPLAGPQPRLNAHGDNLANVIQFLKREHPRTFANVLKRIAEKIPGIKTIEPQETPDGRLLLKFNDRGFVDPFYAQQMSDGTLKLFTYLVLLEDPDPPPFLCIEEPENGLYHKLLEVLAKEFRDHATSRRGSQVFLTTHQPYLVDSLSPEEVWILSKDSSGRSTIQQASRIPVVHNMVEQGLPLGGLWYSDYLDER